MSAVDVVIVGGGVTGLVLGQLLRAGGRAVTVVDKARRPGGRLASRPVGGVLVNTGPQSLQIADPEVAATLRRFAGDQLTDAGQFRESASAFAVALSEGLDYRNALVTHLDEGGPVFWGSQQLSGRTIVLTPPIPQVRALLGRSGLAIPALSAEVGYERRMILLIRGTSMRRPRGSDLFEKIHVMADGVVRAEVGAGWSQQYWDQDVTVTEAELLMEWHRIAPDSKVTAAVVKRWRYANATTPCPTSYASVTDRPIWIAGDGFGSSQHGVQRAVRSALDLADQLLGSGNR